MYMLCTHYVYIQSGAPRECNSDGYDMCDFGVLSLSDSEGERST